MKCFQIVLKWHLEQSHQDNEVLTNCPFPVPRQLWRSLPVSIASSISLLILNKATAPPGTLWPLPPQTITAAADAFISLEAKRALCILFQKTVTNLFCTVRREVLL